MTLYTDQCFAEIVTYTGYLLSSVSSELSRYADYLRAVYSTSPVAISDKFPPTPSKVFIKLALVKNERVSREEADKYTRLIPQGDVDQILQVREPIKMDDILKADDKARLIVVEGAPGIGKSTLAWELCRQWPTLESLKRFSLVVLLRLREEGVQLATDISDLFPCGDDPGLSSLVAQKVKQQNGKGVLFVLDGFDEFPRYLRKSLNSTVMKVIAGELLPKATVIVTSRPSATADLQSVFQTSIGKCIEIVGFSGTEIQSYAESIFGNNSTILASFNSYLSANPVVKGMMYNPLNCAIVVEVYQETYESGKPVPHTQTQLYTELTLCLLSRHLRATGTFGKLPDKLEDLPHDSDLYQQLVKVGKLAFEGKLREEVIFKQLPEGCSDLGLLVEYRALYMRKETSTYTFFHLTLQEYMSAFYISQLKDSEQRTLFADSFLSMNMVWRFVAGLTNMQNIRWDEIEMFQGENYRNYNSGMSIIIQCVYEAQDLQSCERVFDQHQVVALYPGHELSAHFALGYCISLCSNAWDIALRGTHGGPEFEMFSHGLKSTHYGGGSIEKLDLFWYRNNMNEKEYLLQIPHQILQQIKSLTMNECDINQRGFENLAECIPYLDSLTSLDISGNPGGDGSLVKLLQALRKHGKLQTLDMHRISIGMDDVVTLADLVQSSTSLKTLMVGSSAHSHIPLSSDVEQQLVVKIILSSSSLETVWVRTDLIHPLDYLDSISDSITYLALVSVFHKDLIPKSSVAKGGTKLSYILRKNTSLKELKLHIPLDKDEVHSILDSLNDNHSLEKLKLSRYYHSQYFSKSEQASILLDPRVIFD